MESQVIFSCRREDSYFHHTLTPHPETGDISFLSHSHNMYEIYYFLQGEADFVVEGRIHALRRGALILTECGQTHNLLIRSQDASYERMALLFSPYLLPRGFDPLLQAIHGGNNGFSFSERDQQWLEDCFSLLQWADGSDAKTESILQSVIGVIFAKISEKLASGQEHRPEHDDLVSQIIQFIHAHLHENWQLFDLEKALYRDKIYLNRRFRSVMGCGIWEYTMRKRVFIARERLHITRCISDAFVASGFQDYSTFYRRYKKYIGLSPSADLKTAIQRSDERESPSGKSTM